MPQINTSYVQPYDFAAWRGRCNFDKSQAAVTLGVSYSTWLRLEQEGKGQRYYVWAAYGIEQYVKAHPPEVKEVTNA